jgi:hypothetical protein
MKYTLVTKSKAEYHFEQASDEWLKSDPAFFTVKKDANPETYFIPRSEVHHIFRP